MFQHEGIEEDSDKFILPPTTGRMHSLMKCTKMRGPADVAITMDDEDNGAMIMIMW